ncbi:aldehyde dehydrogenase family protein [Amphritea balenae]|uniref:Aldehyde dehydrogenase family protein n=1 Tax=Amphritea balenae TaxID=452629 RepID=A0A3P1SV22_9GAMM|nr:aldehyde dehydrogenase family protein [Amphritea balenae]RRD01064.1 aldehyde dehydrogenase family protein [Amphritea balenae]GGK60230.1 aldehyde dehydrogenase [Amphritea balenae]
MNNEFSLIINGEKVAGSAGSFDVINPATEAVVTTAPLASVEQLDNAVDSANTAFKTWQHSSDEERSTAMHRIADRIEANADELAEIIVMEQGKPMFLAQAEVGGAVAWTRYNADLEIPVKIIEDSEHKRIEAHHKPLGVVGSITPWNWPLMIAIWHIMPALRTGNTVVCKPSEYTPLNTLRLVEIINEELPAGVVNVVTGHGEIGGAMSAHEGISKIVFTGSTPTGQRIMSSAAGNLKRLTLELGGNDAAIIMPDVNVDAIAEGIFQTSFLNMGQTCACLKRLYVHDDIYDQLTTKLAEIAQAQVVGDGMLAGTTFGPVQNANQFRIVSELVEDAKQQRAIILCGGEALAGNGFFYPPTIVTNISDGTRLVDEEQFGPVLPVIRFTDVEDAVARANSASVGLGGSVWSADIKQAQKIASKLECGTAWINGHAEVLPHAPFGGCKMSGFGVEFGEEGMLEYTLMQVLNINK